MKAYYIIIFLLLVSSIVSWSDAGHLLVAQIAEVELLSFHALQLINFTQILDAFTQEQLSDGRSSTFIEASLWADDIKDYSTTLFQQYQRVNRVYDPNGTLAIMQDKDKDINVIYTIGWALNILKKNKNFISYDRAFMARFLLNCVANVHQPLNAIQMFNTTQQYLNGDQGGKLINITTQDGITMSLYDFIETGATVFQKINSTMWNRPLNQTQLQILSSLAISITTQFPKQYFKQLVDVQDPRIWANQSYDYAINEIYTPLLSTNKATPEWTYKIVELCKKRIALAGYRLTKTILSIFKQ